MLLNLFNELLTLDTTDGDSDNCKLNIPELHVISCGFLAQFKDV